MCFKTFSQLPTSQALYEIAFAPEMLPHRIEKERKARLPFFTGTAHQATKEDLEFHGISSHDLSMIIEINP